MARTYKRDSRGRFASGGSARSTPKTRVVTGARAVSGGKNRLTRDNAGRITSVGGQGATARGGRLRTASGAKRGAVIVRMNSTGGKLRKPIGGGAPRISRAEPLATGGTLAARSSLTRARRKLAENATPAQRGAVTRAKKYAAQSYDRNTQPKTFGRPGSVMRKRPPEAPLRWQVGGGKARAASSPQPRAPDTAEVNIRGRFRGQAAKRLDASITRAATEVRAYERSKQMKPKEQVRAEAAARKATKEAAAAAKPKRTRAPLSLRASRAKRIVKEREMKTRGTLRQWENSRRVQERALAIYAQQSRRR
jgi:hypothetical protein